MKRKLKKHGSGQYGAKTNKESEMKKLLFGIICLAIVSALISTSALAWTANNSSGNHEWLMDRLEASLRANNYLIYADWVYNNMAGLKQGSYDADGVYDSREHYCDENGNGLSKSVLGLGSGNFKSSATLGQERYNSAISATNRINMRFYLGAAVHCIQDAACPAHTCVVHNPALNGHSSFESTVDQPFYRTTTNSIGSSSNDILTQIRNVAVSGVYYRGAALTCACTGGAGYGGASDNYTVAAGAIPLAQQWSAWLAIKFFRGFRLGDVNGDAQVTIVDALFIAQYIAGTRAFTPHQQAAADINGDGQVNSTDTTIIAEYTVGLRGTL